MSARLTVRNLSVAFRLPNDQVVTALAGVSCAIAAGEFVCLVGPSGSGKSTLLRVLAGLQAPERGQALIDDELITQPSARVAVMFQDANLMPWRTVIDNIALPLELGGMGREQRYGEAKQLLPQLGLADFANAFPSELSGGMAQRVALGRVLVQRPDILLLDEPFGALDAMTRERVSLDLMALWDGTRPTVLMVTHDIHEAVMLSDRVLVMSRRPGRILADIAVGLPRPRAVADTYHAQFGALAAQVRAAIEDA
jgi:NitT/TauT family transport system ATP-binding protein